MSETLSVARSGQARQ